MSGRLNADAVDSRVARAASSVREVRPWRKARRQRRARWLTAEVPARCRGNTVPLPEVRRSLSDGLDAARHFYGKLGPRGAAGRGIRLA
jgi:hypothetical protein